jgi:hypothetical protein
MNLSVLYVVLVFVGQAIAVAVGVLLDTFSKALGMTVFLALYFAVFVVGWKIAVWLTKRGFMAARLGR